MSISKFERFKTRVVNRSELKNAPYNPRKINDKQKKGLRANLKRVGLIMPILWNERTGNIVSGHQRVAIIDDLEKSSDYELTVAVVDLDEKTEKEQNVFINSVTYQGEFDYDALADLLNSGINYELAGLDEYDLNILGVDLDDATEPDKGRDEEVFEDIQALKEAEKQANIQGIKDRKAASKSEIIERHAEDGEKYVTLSFGTYAAKAAFMVQYGFNADDLFVKGEIFHQILQKNGRN